MNAEQQTTLSIIVLLAILVAFFLLHPEPFFLALFTRQPFTISTPQIKFGLSGLTIGGQAQNITISNVTQPGGGGNTYV